MLETWIKELELLNKTDKKGLDEKMKITIMMKRNKLEGLIEGYKRAVLTGSVEK